MGSLFERGERTVTQESTSRPFEAAVPGITSVLQGAQALPAITPTQSATTQEGLRQLRAAAGRPTVGGAAGAFGREFIGGEAPRTAIGTLEATAAGEGLTGNPFLDELTRRNTERTIDAINARFSGIGQRGSPANQEAIADAIARGELAVQAQNFQQERGRQLGAAGTLLGEAQRTAGMSPVLDEAGLFGPNVLLRAGQIEDAFNLQQQLAPFQALQQRASLINPIATAFGTRTGATTTPTASLGAQLLGGGLSLAGSALGTEAGVGAAGRFLGGLFG